MKKTLALLGWLVAGIALLLNPNTGIVLEPPTSEVVAAAQPTTTGEPPPDTTTSSTAGSTSTAAAPTTTTTGESTTSSEPDFVMVVTGPAVNTEFGAFQVQITFESGVLTEVDTIDEPGDRHSQRINATALPYYEEQAIETQSADFDVLSGATVTWSAYTDSLQAALDMARA